jgi:hypothetical protein
VAKNGGKTPMRDPLSPLKLASPETTNNLEIRSIKLTVRLAGALLLALVASTLNLVLRASHRQPGSLQKRETHSLVIM